MFAQIIFESAFIGELNSAEWNRGPIDVHLFVAVKRKKAVRSKDTLDPHWHIDDFDHIVLVGDARKHSAKWGGHVSVEKTAADHVELQSRSRQSLCRVIERGEALEAFLLAVDRPKSKNHVGDVPRESNSAKS